jgi:hypothetical protein
MPRLFVRPGKNSNGPAFKQQTTSSRLEVTMRRLRFHVCFTVLRSPRHILLVCHASRNVTVTLDDLLSCQCKVVFRRSEAKHELRRSFMYLARDLGGISPSIVNLLAFLGLSGLSRKPYKGSMATRLCKPKFLREIKEMVVIRSGKFQAVQSDIRPCSSV